MSQINHINSLWAENLPIQVLDDQVSRKHLKIGYDKGTKRYFVWDMHSRNGVYLNDMKVSMETALLEGDRLRIGQTDLLFTEQNPDDVEAPLHQSKKRGECQKQTNLFVVRCMYTSCVVHNDEALHAS